MRLANRTVLRSKLGQEHSIAVGVMRGLKMMNNVVDNVSSCKFIEINKTHIH